MIVRIGAVVIAEVSTVRLGEAILEDESKEGENSGIECIDSKTINTYQKLNGKLVCNYRQIKTPH